MSERPIPFSAPMVRALLAGTKTQTRRALAGPNDGSSWYRNPHDGLIYNSMGGPLPKPRYAVGDRLYVREAWTTGAHLDQVAPRDISPSQSVGYLADEHEGPWLGRKRAGMHMPRWASRITLTVTDVRVQRLQEITPADAMAEGVTSTIFWAPKELDARPFEEKWWDDATFWAEYPPQAYKRLWDSINGPDSWDANPWVAAYTFTVALGNIDRLPRANGFAFTPLGREALP